jgi:hypothetical protein
MFMKGRRILGKYDASMINVPHVVFHPNLIIPLSITHKNEL